jgi:hypothetical protein
VEFREFILERVVRGVLHSPYHSQSLLLIKKREPQTQSQVMPFVQEYVIAARD